MEEADYKIFFNKNKDIKKVHMKLTSFTAPFSQKENKNKIILKNEIFSFFTLFRGLNLFWIKQFFFLN